MQISAHPKPSTAKSPTKAQALWRRLRKAAETRAAEEAEISHARVYTCRDGRGKLISCK